MEDNKKHIYSIEETNLLVINFHKINSIANNKENVIPAIVQNINTKEVLTLGYTNQLALKKSLEEKIVVFYSTSRQELWKKGETSKNFFEIKEARVNCEQNSILYLVDPLKNGMCHTKTNNGDNRNSCYYRKIVDNKTLIEIIV